MDDFTIARVIHVVAVLLWIGGVGFVTMVAMPAIWRDHAEDARLGAFQRFEGGFAPQARVWVLLAGANGLWMSWRADQWDRFAHASFSGQNISVERPMTANAHDHEQLWPVRGLSDVNAYQKMMAYIFTIQRCAQLGFALLPRA